MLKKVREFPALHGVWVLLVLIVPAFVLMCGREGMTIDSALRMVNGSTPAEEHPAAWSAVALVDKYSSEHFCSGTVIADNLIVTAAHCVFDKRPEDFTVMFGRDTKDGKSAYREVEALETFKKFQKFESNFDIAWVRFQGGLPQGFKPIEIWHNPADLKQQTPLSIAGYGRTASQCSPDDLSCQGGRLLYVDTMVREFVNHGRLFNLIVIGPRKDHGPCFGDSGGPAYLQKDGTWYVVGDFMGWDRILVSEQLDTICDTGEAIYNFVGDFAQWIQDTSGVKLSYNESLNPMPPSHSLPILTEEPKDFQGWCNYENHEDPAWFTVQRLLRLASDFRIHSGDAQGSRAVFEDCQFAEESLRKMLSTQPSLNIPGFDPANFIDSARLEDVRPLKALADMGLQELTLSDHSIADLSPLGALTSLKKLEVIDNVIPNKRDVLGKPALALSGLTQLEVLHMQNAGALIDFQGMDQLTHLSTLDVSYMDVNTLAGVDQLPLKVLRVDSVRQLASLDLTQLKELQTLYLSKIQLLGWPETMAALESLDLLEVTGLKNLPKTAPQLARIFVYATDLVGEVRLGEWPKLEEASIYSNESITQLSGLSNLPKLRFLDVSENKLQSMAALHNLPSLESLTLVRNGLTALPELSAMPILERLDLDDNRLTSLQGLGVLPKLEYLNASRNPLLDFAALHNQPNLQRIVLQNSKGKGLTSLKGMQDLPKLKELNLGRNSLREVSDALRFPQLEVLVLSDNYIEDISSLKALKNLKYVEVVNNPLKVRDCPVANRPDACRFEWMNLSSPGPIVFPRSERVQRADSLQDRKPFGML